MSRRPIALALMAAACLTAATATATATTESRLTFQPAEAAWGGRITAQAGPCGEYGQVTSPGLSQPITLDGYRNDLTGEGPVVRQAGTYTATLVCDGKTLSAQFTILHPTPRWYLEPTEVRPGGELTVSTDRMSGCIGGPDGPVTSPGFAAPIEFTQGGNFGRIAGMGRAGETPGVYVATLRCRNTPILGEIGFRVLGDPPAPAPEPQPVRPQPIKQPKGAPETGGGGTA
ncbi:hypothetical protein ACQPZF_37880 [Actinosynnema sp. CS-041913]|uniref:hypothetical protein n=1 Tax=Actinosynnema sp. CS-041913 TaxID=3239917 RepID=UPI003D8A41FE